MKMMYDFVFVCTNICIVQMIIIGFVRQWFK